MSVLMKVCQCFLSAEFQSGEPDLYLEAASRSDCESWAVALGEASSEGLRNKIEQLQRLIMEIKEERAADEVPVHQFIPSAQADNLAESKLTSKHVVYWTLILLILFFGGNPLFCEWPVLGRLEIFVAKYYCTPVLIITNHLAVLPRADGIRVKHYLDEHRLPLSLL